MNYYQRRTSETKMKGQVFTPQSLANIIVSLTHEHLFGLVVDPACGEGVFLKAILETRLVALRRQSLSATDKAAKAIDGLVGFDIDPVCLDRARQSLRECLQTEFGEIPIELPVLELGNVVEPSLLNDSVVLRAFKMRSGLFKNGAALVIGNPPYVEAKRMHAEEKKRLRSEYPDAGSGPIDLFVYFTHIALDRLTHGGILAFVLPNKFLVAGYAEQLRRRLLDEFELRHVLFLSHLDVFSGTSVYPIVIVASRKNGRQHSRILLYNPPDSAPANCWIKSPSAVTKKLFSSTESRVIFPVPSNRKEQILLGRFVDGLAAGRLGDILEIKWTISFHSTDIRDHFVFEKRPDSKASARFLGGGRFSGNAEVQRFRVKWNGWWIDYDEQRARSTHNQFPAKALFDRVKIVICQNALRLRAAVDENGYVLKDTFLAGIPRDVTHPLAHAIYAMVGLLNSDIVHFYYSHVFRGGHVGGGYLHYLAPYLRDIPIGRWTSRQIAEVSKLALCAASACSRSEYYDTDQAMQNVIGDVFELDESERRIVANFAASSGDKGPDFTEAEGVGIMSQHIPNGLYGANEQTG